MTNPYIPDRGHIVYLTFDPTKGHEQKGYRPALVLSPVSYNTKTSLALFLPITKQKKGYPFEVILPPGLQTQGGILVDQIKCLYWKARAVKFVESVSDNVVEEVQAKIEPLIL